VKDVQPGSGSGSALNLSIFNNRLFFAANNNVNGFQLWSSDGTAVGTSMFKLINPVASSFPGRIYTLGSQGFFTATGNGTGVELWVTDGTEAGTMLFLDIDNAVNGSSGPTEFKVAGGKLYFSADDGTNGYELWTTDGTVPGTEMYNICPGTCPSFPRDLTVLGNKLIFSAETDNDGRELFALDLPVGVADVANKLQFGMYPNPATSTLMVEADGVEHVAVYDLQGCLMMETQGHYNNTRLDIAHLAQGMYLAKVVNDKGETGIKKFVKE